MLSATGIRKAIRCSLDNLCSYRDAQYTRLGSANIHQIPVNCPFMAKFVSPDNFMGTMRTDVSCRA